MSSAQATAGKLWRNRARDLNMRARAHGADGRLTAIDLRGIVARDDSQCVYCDRPLDYTVAGSGDDTAATFDHVVRLFDGGSHSWENVVCACRRCNQRNAKKSIADPQAAAMERLQRYLARRAA